MYYLMMYSIISILKITLKFDKIIDFFFKSVEFIYFRYPYKSMGMSFYPFTALPNPHIGINIPRAISNTSPAIKNNIIGSI